MMLAINSRVNNYGGARTVGEYRESTVEAWNKRRDNRVTNLEVTDVAIRTVTHFSYFGGEYEGEQACWQLAADLRNHGVQSGGVYEVMLLDPKGYYRDPLLVSERSCCQPKYVEVYGIPVEGKITKENRSEKSYVVGWSMSELSFHKAIGFTEMVRVKGEGSDPVALRDAAIFGPKEVYPVLELGVVRFGTHVSKFEVWLDVFSWLVDSGIRDPTSAFTAYKNRSNCTLTGAASKVFESTLKFILYLEN